MKNLFRPTILPKTHTNELNVTLQHFSDATLIEEAFQQRNNMDFQHSYKINCVETTLSPWHDICYGIDLHNKRKCLSQHTLW